MQQDRGDGRLVAADQPDDAADRGAARQRPPPRSAAAAAPWAALILVVGVNCALYSLLQSKKEAARLDASLDATVAWRERALAAEETVAALAERLGAPPPPPPPRPGPGLLQ